jgi:large subunit ribosomal protein L17
MRHRRRVKYFGVKTAHRKAMFRNMVTALFQHGRITTTVPRAKELRRLADKLVTLAKKGTLHARRQALSVIMDKAVVAKLFEEWAHKMADRPGGYTRIVRIGPRRGDGAMMCVIELVTESLKKSKPKAKVSKADTDEAPTVIPEATPAAEVQEEEGDGPSSSEAEQQATEAESSAGEEGAVEAYDKADKEQEKGPEPGEAEKESEAEGSVEGPEEPAAEAKDETTGEADEADQAEGQQSGQDAEASAHEEDIKGSEKTDDNKD